MSDISFAQFDLLSAMQADDFVVGYRGNREVRVTYLALISGISGVNIPGGGGTGSVSGLDVGSLQAFLSTNNVLLSAGTVTTNLSVAGSLFTNQVLTQGSGAPALSSNTSLFLDSPTRVAILNSPFRIANLATATINSISPSFGDVVYDASESTPKMYVDYNSGSWNALGFSNVQILSTNSNSLILDATNGYVYLGKILNMRPTANARIDFESNLPDGFNLIILNDSTFNVTLTSSVNDVFLSRSNGGIVLSGSNGSSKLYTSSRVYKYGTNIYSI